jgi:tetratricopeptide (TPR) repeat protein
MNVRLVVSFALVLFSSCVHGQTIPNVGDESQPPIRAAASDVSVFRKKLLDQIAVLEVFARQEESAHAGGIKLGRIYSQLGLFYEDTAQWDRSEAALKHSVSLFRDARETNGELAVAIAELGSLHITTGKLRAAEKEEQEALKLREAINDRLQMARSWVDFAALSLAENKFGRAKEFAQKAVAEFAVNQGARPFDRIAAGYALALGLCSSGECQYAVGLLKDGIDAAKAEGPVNDIPVSFGNFLLGYAYWKSGDMADAGPYMQAGTTAMGELLGSGHPSYLAALKHYAEYLREDKNVEAANTVERQIRQTQAVVDVHSIQSGQGAFSFVGLR